MNSGTSVYLTMRSIDLLDLLTEFRIGFASFTGTALFPSVVSTDGNLKHSTHQFHRILLAMVGDEIVLHNWLREKMLTAFFKMSRSCLVTSSSRRRRRFSSSQAV